MGTQNNHQSAIAAVTPGGLPVLDREHLSRYTMDCEELEREIVGLFLTQLPSIMDLLKGAADEAGWRLATHTLKGSALAMGAVRIAEIAKQLELTTIPSGQEPKMVLISVLDREIILFRQEVALLYR